MKGTLRKNYVAFLAYFTITIFVLYSYASAKPNIIFILADDLGYGDLGCYGQQRIKTPNIDSLAKQSVRYTSCYAGCAVSAPSRCCLMTGMHTGHTYIRGNLEIGAEGQQPLAADEITVADILKGAGYTTGLIGKWGLGMNGTVGDPSSHGFTYYYSVLCQRQAHTHYASHIYENGTLLFSGGTHGFQDDLFRDKAIQFITNNKDKPFFLYLTFCSPHSNMEVPDITPYQNTSWTSVEKTFAAMVTRLDSNVAKVLSCVKQLGLDSTTIIFFASDNGAHSEGGHSAAYFTSSGPLRGIKRDLWDGGIRVPMIVRWTGHTRPGRTSDFVWAFWDFLPTAAEIAGAKPPRGLDGFSVLPEILGNGQTPHPYLYWEFSDAGYTTKQATRIDSIKAVRIWPTQQPMIYNVVRDIGEATDLAASQAAYVARIKRIMNIVRFPSKLYPKPEMDTIAGQDLVARYTFDNNGADSSYNLFPSLFEGTPYFTFGRQGTGGLYVDGKSGYGIVQRNVAYNLTIAFWLKTPSAGGSAWTSAAGLVDGKTAADSSFGAGLTSGKVAVAIGNQLIATTGLADNGQWRHITVTRSGVNGLVLLYIDGVQSGSGTGPAGWLTKSKALTVGSLSTDNGILTGAFDDLRFYNYILTAAAIQTLAATTQAAMDISAATRIQAESYAVMNSVQLQATADSDSGLQIGGVSAGSWADYRINVLAAGSYTVSLRVLNTGTAASVNLLSNSAQIGTLSIPSQTGWQTVSTPAPITLTAGIQTLRVSVASGANMAVNWIDLRNGTAVSWSDGTPMFTNASIEICGGTSNRGVRYSAPTAGPVTISIAAVNGRLLAKWQHTGSAGTINHTTDPRLAAVRTGVYILTLDQEGKRIALTRTAVLR